MDTSLALERVNYRLDTVYSGLIDMLDYDKRPGEREAAFRSRGAAAFALENAAGIEPKVAAASIVDAFGDGGIDAIYYSELERTLYVVQAKWSKDGNRGVEQSDTLKFISGLRCLIRADFSGFNPKIKRRELELRSILRSDAKFALIVVYNSQQPMAPEVRKPIDELVANENVVAGEDVFRVEVFDITNLYTMLSGSATQSRVTMNVVLTDWGMILEPFRAYYGQVALSDVAEWVSHGKALSAANIRFYQGNTEVNESLERTILNEPEHFWYFNNGITIVCDKITKQRVNGDLRNYGIFDCHNASVVNGAQTVGVISKLLKTLTVSPATSGKVAVRLISLDGCPPAFKSEIARATNTQNRILPRDYAALDSIQHRLAEEMRQDGKQYAYKSGDDQNPKNEEGCTFEEAAVALACASGNLPLAVESKREVGKLWVDMKKEPYITLFNDRLTARQMWRCVRILRTVSSELDVVDLGSAPRAEYVAVHGNRFIVHRVFADPELKGFRNPSVNDTELLELSKKITRRVFLDLALAIESLFPQAYLANLFKNTPKCEELAKSMDQKRLSPNLTPDPAIPPQDGGLFAGLNLKGS